MVVRGNGCVTAPNCKFFQGKREGVVNKRLDEPKNFDWGVGHRRRRTSKIFLWGGNLKTENDEEGEKRPEGGQGGLAKTWGFKTKAETHQFRMDLNRKSVPEKIVAAVQTRRGETGKF